MVDKSNWMELLSFHIGIIIASIILFNKMYHMSDCNFHISVIQISQTDGRDAESI